MIKIHKTNVDVDSYEAMLDWPEQVRPRRISYSAKQRCLSYMLETGRHPTSAEIWDWADRFIWKGPALPIDYDTFAQYMWQHLHFVSQVKVFLKHIRDLTPVGNCHGDMTLVNAIMTKTRLVFIDPGKHRGLPCREIDEAKILQSLDGFCTAYRGSPVDLVPCDQLKWPTKTQLALLGTHYIRLWKHIVQFRGFAEERITRIAKWLS